MISSISDNFIMFVFCVLAVLVTKFDFAFGASISTDAGEKDLLLAFVVNRHGERTPAEEEAALSKDSKEIWQLIKMDGYEALTQDGKRRAYQLGKFLRQRYGSNQGYHLLSKLYLSDEIRVRTTAKDRTQMTAQIAMAALYSPEPVQQWDDGLGRIWQPVPYTVVPQVEDYLRFYNNCNRFKVLMRDAKNASLHEELAPFSDLLPIIEKETGADFREDPLLFQTLFDLLRSQIGLGLTVPKWAQPLLPRLTEAARLAYSLYFRNDEMKKIGGGVVLNEFVEAAEAIIAGEKMTKRFRLYSSHDFNIGSLMDVSKVEYSRSIPEYGALFALELYRTKATGEYSVLPVFLSQAGTSSAKQLRIRGCDDHYCEFDKFRNTTAEFLLPEREYYQLCGIRTEL